MSGIDLSRDYAVFAALERYHLTQEGNPATEADLHPEDTAGLQFVTDAYALGEMTLRQGGDK